MQLQAATGSQFDDEHATESSCNQSAVSPSLPKPRVDARNPRVGPRAVAEAAGPESLGRGPMLSCRRCMARRTCADRSSGGRRVNDCRSASTGHRSGRHRREALISGTTESAQIVSVPFVDQPGACLFPCCRWPHTRAHARMRKERRPRLPDDRRQLTDLVDRLLPVQQTIRSRAQTNVADSWRRIGKPAAGRYSCLIVCLALSATSVTVETAPTVAIASPCDADVTSFVTLVLMEDSFASRDVKAVD